MDKEEMISLIVNIDKLVNQLEDIRGNATQRTISFENCEEGIRIIASGFSSDVSEDCLIHQVELSRCNNGKLSINTDGDCVVSHLDYMFQKDEIKLFS